MAFILAQAAGRGEGCLWLSCWAGEDTSPLQPRRKEERLFTSDVRCQRHRASFGLRMCSAFVRFRCGFANWLRSLRKQP